MLSLHEEGYAIVPGVLDAACVAGLITTVETYCDAQQAKTGRAVHAIRNLAESLPELAGVACRPEIRGLVEPILGPDAFVVRAIYFDKLPGANWKVPWHQDQTIAVRQRINTPGFGPWSVKESVPHVEPPIMILEQMLTVRIHLDDCTDDNGPLRVIPRSHQLGRLSPDSAPGLLKKHGEVSCTVNAGGAVLMRPTTLHASSPAASPAHRRVIHIEFSADKLPGGLAWMKPDIPSRCA